MKDKIRDNKSEFPYKEEPKVNFFYYPPMKDLEGGKSISIKEDLHLEQKMKYTSLFSIYISIPYCRTRCNSCGCFRGFLPKCENQEAFTEEYVECLIRQIHGYSDTLRFRNATCTAVYIGGGTASVLSHRQVKRLIDEINKSFQVVPDMEINLEGNPIDFNREYLEKVKEYGVTRISIGYQSGIPSVLKALNTSHTAEIGNKAVENALATGFHTVNVDLLYNVPGQTFEQWKEDLQRIIAYSPQNISAGDYMVYEGSAADGLIKSGALPKQHDVDVVNQWYRYTCLLLNENGYYERVRGIFAKEGHVQQYVQISCNESTDIIGLGSGACGFINGYQFRVTNSSELYKKQIMEGKLFETDSVSVHATERMFMERYIMHNFYSEVVKINDFIKRFGSNPLEVFKDIFDKLLHYQLIEVDDSEIRLTDLGKKWRRSVYYEFHEPQFKVTE